MKKRMFSKFSSILQHAVDALAPQLSLQEEFVFHWKAVTSYFIDNKGEKLPVEQTNIPAHLEQMLVILQEEEMTSERGMYGPCLEYLLQHKLLETLYSLGRADYPPGMKQIVLSFFTKLLSRIKQPILAHINVYKAVQRLVSACGEVQAAPSEIEEIQFLCTVCAKIKADPYLVNFFLEMPKQVSTGANSPIIEEPVSGTGNKLFQEFNIVTTLLTLSHSADSRVAVKACEGLILCSSLPEPIAAHCLINSTKFCKDLTQRLIETYQKLPETINPSDLEHVQAKWGMEVVTEREDHQTFVGKHHLVSFLSWLDYCDQLTGIANPIVAEALSRTIHQKFLIPCVQPSLLQASEVGAISATAYLTRCLHTVSSERLLSDANLVAEFVCFLLDEEKQPETPKNRQSDTVRSRLIDRCNHVSEEVCLVTLQLFDTLLQKDEEHILSNLVLRNLTARGYYDYNHLSNDKGLPSQVQEEFSNIVNQSKNSQKEQNDVQATECISENTGPNASDGMKECAIETNESLTESSRKETKFDGSGNKELTDRAKDEVGTDINNEEINKSLEDSETVSEAHKQLETSIEGYDNISITQTESSKSEILTKATCDTDKIGADSSEQMHSESQEKCNSVYPDGSSVVKSDKDNLPNLADDLDTFTHESQGDLDTFTHESQGESKEGMKLENKESSNTESVIQSPCDQSEDGFRTHSLSPRRSRIEVHNVVNCFLSIVPEDLKSSYQMSDRDSGYDLYLRDAHLQYADVVKACKDWNYPEDVVRSQETIVRESFYEGDFLHMLLDKLSHLLDQSYPVNLQLTSVISKLALVPHPNLHEFLLDPYLPLRPNVRSLYSVLQKLSSEIKSQLASQPNLAKQLVDVRRQLMSSSPNLTSLRKNLTVYAWVEGQGRLEAIIVLEEFCKELSAIAFIKHHAAVTSGKH